VPPRRELRWSGWGDPAQAVALDPHLAALAQAALGLRGPRPPLPREQVRLAPSRLSDRLATQFGELLGEQYVRRDQQWRLTHARGKSTPDLLRMRAGSVASPPDAVLLPAGHDEVLAVLELCAQARIAVVPFGGGTSVVGGLEPDASAYAATVALDLRRLDRLLELDEVSRTATLEPGLQGPQAEALLGAHGYTLGHYPQSFEYATVGGFAATRSSGQASAGYGRFDERVLAVRLATPRGTLELGRAPRSAAGPDLRQVALGSEGAFGVITALRVEVSPAPERRLYEGWRFPSFAHGLKALRRLAQDGPRPTVLRLSDEAETALDLGAIGVAERSGGASAGRPETPPSEGEPGSESQGGGGALAITGYEGTAHDVRRRREQAAAIIRELGGRPAPGAGERWAATRYRAPYLRDALLDEGALAETLETACFWSRLEATYKRVGDALRKTLAVRGTPPLVLCHVSHVYSSGASLYFTIVAAAAADPLAQWREAKQAATEAILASGATISHHHGVGRDHRPAYARELGPLGVELLRALKATLDPDGILNPGVLVP
jgi:alkyldihydroxyacetonephosphate synthase